MSSKNKNGKMFFRNLPYYAFAVGFLAFGVGFLHIYHVSTLFENDRHFSHLSTLEREMAFYTEMGLYYSYYKTLVEAPSYMDGLLSIMYDNKTEYPSIINTLQRFNLYPEVVVAFFYRGYLRAAEDMNFTTKHCWQVDRGNGLMPVLSCEGLGDPAYFYLEAVWICAGLTMTVVFLFGQMLSGSIVGGALSVISFFYNHGECTRVQWTPPLRESFAYPFCLLQMLALTKVLHLGSSPENRNHSILLRKVLFIWIPTWIFLILWQFAQFVLTTQLLAVFFLYVLGIIKRNTFLPIIYGYALAVSHAAFSLFVNEFLIFSFLTTTLIAIMVLSMGLLPVLKNYSYLSRVLILCMLTPILTIVIKSQMVYFSGYKDDMHIVNLLKAKFLGYKDFHTLLYTCSAEFDFMPLEFFKNVTKTLLLPSAILTITLVLYSWTKTLSIKPKQEKTETSLMIKLRSVDPVVAYNILQLIAFGIMAALIMRLKLFFTPHLCLIYSPWRSQELRLAFVFLLISGMSVRGFQNLKEQRDILGEYSNVPMEQLLNWINLNTKTDAVFAGPMPLMANVLLSTRRPIVNHPHYEDASLRARTKNVYSIFSRRTPQEVYVTLSQMNVDYVILGETWCFGESKKGCRTKDLWDIEEPKNIHRPAVCPILFHGNPSPFIRVFSNDVYVVLKVHSQSQYVELQTPMIFSQ
ncbi:C-mannosyltransferase dpy-19 homolog [Gryllus bimaculatus]|nr:C-mannosyltransferase dpy-19 homolog [Gryllus bimaculatus]